MDTALFTSSSSYKSQTLKFNSFGLCSRVTTVYSHKLKIDPSQVDDCISIKTELCTLQHVSTLLNVTTWHKTQTTLSLKTTYPVTFSYNSINLDQC